MSGDESRVQLGESDDRPPATPDPRVMVVGESRTDSWSALLPGMELLGGVPPDEVVPSVDTLRPNVLLLDPGFVKLVPRLASGPVGVVVASPPPDDPLEESSGFATLLEVALQLALVSP